MADGVLLRGCRIVVRDWRVEDLEPLAHWLQPGHAWRALDGPYYAQPNAEEVAARLAKIRARVEAAVWPDPRKVLVIADAENDALLGRVSRYWQSEETHWLSVGVDVFDPERWGRGIGYEALGLWGQYLLDTLPELARLDLRTWSGNTGMMRLAEKLGYVQEARFRDARVVDGERYDGLGYGVLRSEWDARYPDGFAAHMDRASDQ